jgi:hypothetical protein
LYCLHLGAVLARDGTWPEQYIVLRGTWPEQYIVLRGTWPEQYIVLRGTWPEQYIVLRGTQRFYEAAPDGVDAMA